MVSVGDDNHNLLSLVIDLQAKELPPGKRRKTKTKVINEALERVDGRLIIADGNKPVFAQVTLCACNQLIVRCLEPSYHVHCRANMLAMDPPTSWSSRHDCHEFLPMLLWAGDEDVPREVCRHIWWRLHQGCCHQHVWWYDRLDCRHEHQTCHPCKWQVVAYLPLGAPT